MRHKFWTILIAIFLTGALAACGNTNSQNSTGASNGDNGGSESAAENTESETEVADEEVTEEDSADEQATFKEDATYVGQIDTHSIEVETSNGEILVLQINYGDDLSFLEENAPISVEYYKNENGQNVLVNLTEK